MNEYALTLDLAKAKQRQQQTIFVRQGDRNATTIVATITDHGVAASTSGMAARFSMRLPNGTEYYRKTASLSGNTATVTIDEAQAASAVGRTDTAYFQLLQGSTVVASTESFTVIVLPDALADATVPESYDSAIQDAIDALDAAVEQLPATVETVLTGHPEWTTTVQDGSITQAKLATDLARDRERLLYRLANILTNALPEGETATASDAAKTPVAGLALYGKSTQAGTPTPSAPVSIESVAAANLLPNAASTQTVNGLTFTVNADGSITVTGTATARTDFVLASGITFAAGTYTISGAPQSTGTGDWNLRVDMAEQPKTNYVFDNGYTSGNNRTNAIPAGVAVDAIIRVYAGKSPNATFYPMLNAGSTAYPYVPYGNVGLWAIGRNLIKRPYKSGMQVTTNGITWTANDDGSITANGTATANSNFILNDRDMFGSHQQGTYTISGSPAVAGCYVCLQRATEAGGMASVMSTAGNAATFTTDTELAVATGNNSLFCRVPNGTTVNNAVFRPQVERGSTAHAYEPYTYTVTPIPLDGHELRSLPDGTRDEVTVDERGHAVLVQRVGSVTLDGSSDEVWSQRIPNSGDYLLKGFDGAEFNTIVGVPKASGYPARCTRLARHESGVFSNMPDNAFMLGASTLSGTTDYLVVRVNAYTTLADFKAWLAANTMTLDYPLATPVTHDLGTIDPVPLCGPDLTAQAIPTAPMQLTYERDLNTTLARLESAIAELATN